MSHVIFTATPNTPAVVHDGTGPIPQTDSGDDTVRTSSAPVIVVNNGDSMAGPSAEETA